MCSVARWRQTSYSFGLSCHPLANEWCAVLQDDTLSLRRGQEANGSDVREPQVVEVEGRWTAICRKLCAQMFEVFRPHVADQTNRGSVFADVGDDPERHSQGVPRPVTPCKRRTDCQSCGANNLRASDPSPRDRQGGLDHLSFGL